MVVRSLRKILYKSKRARGHKPPGDSQIQRKKQLPMPTYLESTFMNMDDDELLSITQSEDYRPEAKRLAKALLVRRRLPADIAGEWGDAIADFTTKPWAMGKAESSLRRTFKRRRLGDRLIFWLLVTLSIFSMLAALGTFDPGSFLLMLW